MTAHPSGVGCNEKPGLDTMTKYITIQVVLFTVSVKSGQNFIEVFVVTSVLKFLSLTAHLIMI